VRTPVQWPQQNGHPPPQAVVPFPFGVDFQAKLMRVLLSDDGTSEPLLLYLRPEYFESPPLQWMLREFLAYREQYGANPTAMVLLERAKQLDPKLGQLYAQAIEHVRQLDVKEEQWVKNQVLDWVKRCIFVEHHRQSQQLYNTGKITEAYDAVRRAMDLIDRTTWEVVDRGWFFEELPAREAERGKLGLFGKKIGTGIPGLNKLLGGGLGPGEMGIWIGVSKGGKSVRLVNQGAVAVAGHLQPVLHFVLEGSRRMAENRYDALFMDELYSSVKTGKTDEKRYAVGYQRYQQLRGKLVIRGLVESWSYSILDIDAELKALRRLYGWKPAMIILDYGDLLRGREKSYSAPWMSERDAYRDMKLLANRGYAFWTAAQADRPSQKAGEKEVETILKSSHVAGSIEKVRVADFIGSLNMTEEERHQGVARVHAELYRDAAAGETFVVGTDLKKMKYGLPLPTVIPHGVQAAPTNGKGAK
jgi:tetratricopeptide (TPR) repeat protein